MTLSVAVGQGTQVQPFPTPPPPESSDVDCVVVVGNGDDLDHRQLTFVGPRSGAPSGPVATSIAVHAIPSALDHGLVGRRVHGGWANSGWWLTAPPVSMPRHG